MTDAGMGQRVSDLEREVSLLKNRLKKAESFDGSRIVRSGNSRVKLTIYGQVSRAVRFGFDKHNTEVHHVDTDGSGSRLGFLARGRVDPDLAISGRIVVGWQENRRSATHDGNGPNTRLRSRRVEIWTDHKDLGQLWLGKGSIAGDAAHLITMSGTSPIFGFGGPGGDDGTRATGKDGDSKHNRHGFFSFFGQRENRIMYATPNVMGFRALVSHSERDTVSAGLHYAGTPFGMKDVRAAMRFGWQRQPGEGATAPAPANNAGDAEAYGVSGGIMHVPTGLNLSGSWASRDNKRTRNGQTGMMSPDLPDPDMFAVEVGWTGSIWDMGSTSVSFGYGRWNDWELGGGRPPSPVKGYTEHHHVAVNQNVDPAAADVYFGVSYDDGKNMVGKMLMEREAVVVVVTGVRIKF